LTGNLPFTGSRPLASVLQRPPVRRLGRPVGDGRAILLGEVETPQGRQELQLKGSGLTPYSRMGDGRAVLRSSIPRLPGLGGPCTAWAYPTTRALSVTSSPQPVRREEIETAAVVLRVAPELHPLRPFRAFLVARPAPASLRQLADLRDRPSSIRSAAAATGSPAIPMPRCWNR
jgi:uncharacterized protein YdiU (UPF0061 family)